MEEESDGRRIQNYYIAQRTLLYYGGLFLSTLPPLSHSSPRGAEEIGAHVARPIVINSFQIERILINEFISTRSECLPL